jgi:hypothetical protein
MICGSALSDCNSLDFIERDLIAGTITELGGARTAGDARLSLNTGAAGQILIGAFLQCDFAYVYQC